MDTFGQDLSYSLRSLRKAPAFTAVAIITLALGVGANSAIFSVLNAVLLRPLPFFEAERVVNVAWDGSGYLQALSSAKFQYWHDHIRSFEAMATWRSSLEQAGVADETSTVRALAVSRDFLEVVRYAPTRGRAFEFGDVAPGAPSVAIISQATWQTRFGSAADVVGRTIRLDGNSFTIVGVLPGSFGFPYVDAPVDVIVPLRMTVDPNDVAENWPTIARLHAGVTPEQAQAEVATLMPSFRAVYPNQVANTDRGTTLATFSDLYVDGGVRRALWILMSAVIFVLLIACVNVANLFLARATRRQSASGEILRELLGNAARLHPRAHECAENGGPRVRHGRPLGAPRSLLQQPKRSRDPRQRTGEPIGPSTGLLSHCRLPCARFLCVRDAMPPLVRDVPVLRLPAVMMLASVVRLRRARQILNRLRLRLRLLIRGRKPKAFRCDFAEVFQESIAVAFEKAGDNLGGLRLELTIRELGELGAPRLHDVRTLRGVFLHPFGQIQQRRGGVVFPGKRGAHSVEMSAAFRYRPSRKVSGGSSGHHAIEADRIRQRACL
jgi:hypothetical protein